MANLDVLEPIHTFFRDAVARLNITPSWYIGLFPPVLNPQQINEHFQAGVFPAVQGLAPAFTYCIIFSVMRYFLHIFIIQPLAEVAMDIKEEPLEPIADIDAEFKNHAKFVDTATIKKYCSRTGKKVSDVRNYLWLRKKNDVVKKKIVKFVEASWRCIFYSTFTVMGYYALFVPDTAIWLKDSMNYFIGWPNHPIPDAIALYYQVELGCYFHQLLWTEVDHSDALQMLIHHFVTISLLLVSWVNNFTRFGATVLFIHDLPDVLLESCKVLHYTAQPEVRAWMRPFIDGLFVCFMITFFVTRLIVYPSNIVYPAISRGLELFGCDFGGCYVYIFLLCSLQCLHIFWFYLIARMAYGLVVVGKVEKDVRSDDEGDDMVYKKGPPPLEDGDGEGSGDEAVDATATGDKGEKDQKGGKEVGKEPTGPATRRKKH